MDNTVNNLSADAVSDASDPLSLFAAWMEEAAASEPNDPNAMALATVDPDGLPDVRMVLLKSIDANGFVFYTNAQSTKGAQLSRTGKAAFVLHWKSLRRQVRARGTIATVTNAEADAYFRTRSRDSRLGAWASQQSRALASRRVLEEAVAVYAAKYPGNDVPRPPYWTGFRIRPLHLEFWRDRPFRLHDRLVFRRAGVDHAWCKEHLYP